MNPAYVHGFCDRLEAFVNQYRDDADMLKLAQTAADVATDIGSMTVPWALQRWGGAAPGVLGRALPWAGRLLNHPALGWAYAGLQGLQYANAMRDPNQNMDMWDAATRYRGGGPGSITADTLSNVYHGATNAGSALAALQTGQVQTGANLVSAYRGGAKPTEIARGMATGAPVMHSGTSKARFETIKAQRMAEAQPQNIYRQMRKIQERKNAYLAAYKQPQTAAPTEPLKASTNAGNAQMAIRTATARPPTPTSNRALDQHASAAAKGMMFIPNTGS